MELMFFIVFTLVKFLVGVAVFYYFTDWLLSEKIAERERLVVKHPDPVLEKMMEKQKNLLGNSIILSLFFSVFAYLSEFIAMFPLGILMYLLYPEISIFYCFGLSFLAFILIWVISSGLTILFGI